MPFLLLLLELFPDLLLKCGFALSFVSCVYVGLIVALFRYHEAWGQPGAASGMVNWYRAAILGNLIRRSTPKRVENTPTLVIWGGK